MIKWLLLNWKRGLLIIGAWVLAVVLHNVIYGLFQEFWGPGGDEPFFFLLAVMVIPAYFIISLVYTLIHWLGTRKSEKHVVPPMIGE